MLKLFRTNTWWNAVVPQVLGWIYLFATGRNVEQLFLLIFPFFVALISISVFGYLFNDLCDVKADSKAGKSNLLSSYSVTVRLMLVFIPLVLGCVAWYYVMAGVVANILFALQILALVLYSAPPIRLKERGMAGIIADAFYGHINPVFITIFWMVTIDSNSIWLISLLLIVFVCTTLKGIRNILLHQIDDRRADRNAGVKTFVVRNGALGSLIFINYLIPFEVLLALCFAVLVSIAYPPFFVWTLMFFILTYLKFSGWKLRDLPKRQLQFKFLYFLNDYYEAWVPVGFLLLLSAKQPQFFILLILHLVLFPGFITKLWNDVKIIKENFKTEDEY